MLTPDMFKTKFKLLRKQKRIYISTINYSFVTKIRAVNKRMNLGKIYFENMYIIAASKTKANII